VTSQGSYPGAHKSLGTLQVTLPPQEADPDDAALIDFTSFHLPAQPQISGYTKGSVNISRVPSEQHSVDGDDDWIPTDAGSHAVIC